MDIQPKIEVEEKKKNGSGSSNTNTSIMKESMMLVCCKVYISESRNMAALDSIEQAAKVRAENVIVVNRFLDPAYNRVGYTLVCYLDIHGLGRSRCPLLETVCAMVEAAYEAIDLQRHSGFHPRFGVVDHICFHPLAGTSLAQAAHLAKVLASDVGNRFQVPVYLYDAAHPTGKALDAIRRELGYYQPNYMGIQWSGWALPHELLEKPDEGPSHVNPGKGIVVIGASPWADTYNVPLLSSDVSTAKRIARQVSARGGGLPSVQALALVHGEASVEVACIILEPGRVGADRVLSQVERLASEEGLEVGQPYFTDLSQEMIVDKYLQSISAGQIRLPLK